MSTSNQEATRPKESPTVISGPGAVAKFLEAVTPRGQTSVQIRTPLDMERGNPFDADYYTEKRHNFQLQRGRSLSIVNDRHEGTRPFLEGMPTLRRRLSHDEFTNTARTFRVAVDSTLRALEEAEDTDKNGQITLEDSGPKSIILGTAASHGFNGFNIRGTYLISNLYQELTIAKAQGRTIIFLDEERINENPVSRLSRLIHQMFWPGLTRTLDASSIHVAAKDPKAERFADPRPRVYVPATCKEQIRYYTNLQLTVKDLDVCILPEDITPEYVFSINDKPGILALDMQELDVAGNGNYTIHGLPFVVPGGRFNELYGWDSYFMALGLLQHDTTVHLAYSMVVNFIFEIQHYGKILNANRSYYLSRSQPPFLTDMAIQTYHKMSNDPNALNFLRDAILAAIKEYFNVWMALPRLDKASGLSRYRPDGIGIPPETEASHFDSIMKPYADKHGISLEQFQDDYNFGRIKEPELDEYFLHDRAVRESGHDTTYRLDGVCADLATIDLQSLLYKYEVDIAKVIREKFNDRLVVPKHFRWKGMGPNDEVQSSTAWDRRARRRKAAVDKLLWDQERGLYMDYNTKLKKKHEYESATTFWPLWAGMASPMQAAALVEKALPLFEKPGGLVSGTERSRGEVGLDRPNRQWDFPYGWAPHQMLAWKGLKDYGYEKECQRLCLRWLSMMLKSFIYYHGIVVEKYDVLGRIDPHRVDAEYGNQGADIRGAATEGFGWVNASFQVGLGYLTTHMRRCLATQMEPDKYFAAIDREEYWDDGAIEDSEPGTPGSQTIESPLSERSCYF